MVARLLLTLVFVLALVLPTTAGEPDMVPTRLRSAATGIVRGMRGSGANVRLGDQ